MFGLKLVNKKSYLELQDDVEWYKRVASEKDSFIANLEGEIKGLRSEISRLEKEVETLNKPKKTSSKKVVLLTDVAETPLEEEHKPIKRRSVTKKSGTSTSKKKVTERK